jgi:hypothetical protein
MSFDEYNKLTQLLPSLALVMTVTICDSLQNMEKSQSILNLSIIMRHVLKQNIYTIKLLIFQSSDKIF